MVSAVISGVFNRRWPMRAGTPQRVAQAKISLTRQCAWLVCERFLSERTGSHGRSNVDLTRLWDFYLSGRRHGRFAARVSQGRRWAGEEQPM